MSRIVWDVLVDGRAVVRDQGPTGVELSAVAAAATDRSAALRTPRPDLAHGAGGRPVKETHR
ncbi:hypothetical protein [Streptomyces albipurpureus]|uniref:Uncharacterized protein n=1 Tax=Streptomyces albipurpureus TaxID=2897419 RepID=A0ABT0UUW3_9ACTN|nr:hypothetical protein [Streptomyces sp. CWNU-1]MCM2391910.1 hypothetical protein [Streptomyces sp. CWNU-1]